MILSSRLIRLLFCVIALSCFYCSIETTHAKTVDHERLFYITDTKSGIDSFKKNAHLVDVIAPQSYTLSAKLTITGKVNEEIRQIAKNNSIEVVPLLVNAGFSQKIIHNLLVSPSATQDRIINFMIDEAIKNGYSGWQFDLEHIHYSDRDAYSRFVERTSAAFKKKALSLSIAAVARINNEEDADFYKNWSGVFDYERLSKSLDFISIMTYDDPNSVGPTASMPFVESVYEYLKEKVPPEKLSLGVPFYYWGWSVNPHKRVRSGGTYQRLKYLRASFKTVEGFDSKLQVPFLKYSTGGKDYIVWHEDAKSFEKKVNFVRENNLRGFSAWVLGLENPDVWSVLEENVTL